MIKLKSREEIEKIKESCTIVSCVLKELSDLVKPGITTNELDSIAEKRILSRNAKPAFKGYRGFPKTLCTSVNDEIVHGIPSARVLKAGDIISIDCGVLKDGFYGDGAITVPVAEIDEDSKRLLRVTKEALLLGIEQAKIGNHILDISRAIQDKVEMESFSIVREFVGHGIGRDLHEDPQVPNYVLQCDSPLVEPGTVIAIEPMVTFGKPDVIISKDGWTAQTKDRSRSAHFEHTVAITNEGTLILTNYSGDF